MGFCRQSWTLTGKTLLIVAWRRWVTTALRALVLPIAFAIFLGYVRTFLAPPSTFGIGSPTPIQNITELFPDHVGNRRRIAFVNNGYTGGEIEQVINAVADPLRAVGADVRILSSDSELLETCRSSLRGFSACYGAVSFYASPSEGFRNEWSYRLTTDFVLGYQVWVDRTDNDAQVYALPILQAVDAQIARLSGTSLPETILEYPYTTESEQERNDRVQVRLMGSVGSWLGVCFFLAMCGVSYHLPGFVASERELGMSQLIDSMVPSSSQVFSQLSRFLSTQAAFFLIYIPSWISIGAISTTLVFLRSSDGLIVGFHILTGIALCCYAAFGASFFRRAQLSGITVLISALVLAIVAQLAPISSPSSVIVLSALFPSAAYTFFFQEVARWEAALIPINLGEVRDPNSDRPPGYTYLACLVAQIVYYPILATLVERWRFGTSSSGRKLRLKDNDQQVAIRVQNFSKKYRPGFWQKVSFFTSKWKAPVLAVSNLNLTVLKGETMVLLGANGSGKSTTLDTISGIISPSQGLIEIDGSGGIGLCPQKNVLWAELTVSEHVAIFNQIKANPKPNSKQEILQLVADCDLEGKMKKKSKALSGGQKRKLQLAMAFAGGSHVCCIDEVTSGLDPLSRRKIWDILIQERGKRTLLFTTHSLDEADALADHVAVMSKGHLKVEGSVVELKNAHGGGYKVHVPGRIEQPSTSLVPATRNVGASETIFQVQSSQDAARLVEDLESHGIHEFQVNGPTIEDVFLRVADEGRDELEPRVGAVSVSPNKSVHSSALSSDSDLTATNMQLDLRKGQDISVFRQTWILLRKRLRIFTRNYVPYFCAVAVPLIAAGLVTFFLGGFNPLVCALAANSDSGRYIDFNQISRYSGALIPVGPSNRITRGSLPSNLLYQLSDNLVRLNTYNQFQRYVANNTEFINPGGFFLSSTSNPDPVLAYRADGRIIGGIQYAAFAKSILDQYLSNTSINVQLATFSLPFASSLGNSLQLIIYLGLAMSTYPAFFALYPTYERLRNIRALHYSNGIQAGSLWLAYFAFDLVFVIIVSVCSIIVLVSLSDIFYAPGYLWVVFFLFGLSSTLYAYIVSLFATSQLAAFAFTAGGQAVGLLLYFIAYIGLVSFSLPEQLVGDLNVVQFTYGLITPSGNLLRALMLSLNISQLRCRNQTYISYPADIQVYGGPILYLTLQIFAFYAILVAYENGWAPKWSRFRRNKKGVDQEKSAGLVDKEVYDETFRTEKSQDALQVLHVNKSFGSEVAVDDLTFGVKHGEVFALLGPNGAGKSTTISLIRGDLRPSTKESNILVEGISVNDSRTATRRNLGVCPQFDAIDRMTVTEHLRFYARASGVRDVRNNVEKVIEAVGLHEFRNRMADQLSGGNKRKLSLGISIIGNPSVLLLDEPSSGMDAISKRIMWRLLSAVKTGRSLVLTTHSMEEVDALADRAGIMAKRMLAVGTTGFLRSNHGSGFYIHLIHKDAPHVSDAQRRALESWIYAHVPGATPVGGDVLHGQMKFHVPNVAPVAPGTALSNTGTGQSGTSMVEIMKLLERNKAHLGVGFYSVAPTTLEDVFMDIVGKHGVVEHDER